VGLSDRANDKVQTFSGGMKRRLNLAAALLHDPQILLLDEPTVGVDPQSRNAIFDNLETLKKRGKTLIYTTHYMEEAERLCDRIVIIDHGKVVANDTLQELHKLLPVTNVIAVELDHADGFKPEQMLSAAGSEVRRVDAKHAPGRSSRSVARRARRSSLVIRERAFLTIMSRASSQILRPSFSPSREGAFETRNDSIPGPGAKRPETVLQRPQSGGRRDAGSHRLSLLLRLPVWRPGWQRGDQQGARAGD
jgi:ABC-type multidrug transport system ATPase subunit